MSERIAATKLYQIGRNYDLHRLEINRIKTKSSPVLRKKQQQDSIIESRHYHQTYNSKFKKQQSQNQIQKKNTKIISKILSLSKVKRPNSTSHSQIINRMESSRISFKRQTMRGIEQQNQRFVKKLTNIKSSINCNSQSNGFKEHRARSQMLSKFKVNAFSGGKMPKNTSLVERRLKLEPIHQKLKLIQEKQKSKYGKPLKFNSIKLEKYHYNPEISRSIQLKRSSRGIY